MDVYAAVEGGDLNSSVLRSARLGYGPSNEEIRRGDYTNFPYERYRGVVVPGESVPLLWDKEPDLRNGRVIGFSDGTVYWREEDEVRQILRSHGQIP